MTKRVATNELNHLNWNRQDESDDEDNQMGSGEFKKASDEALKQRVFKVAKRTLHRPVTNTSESLNETPTSIFSNFKGFQKVSNNTDQTPSSVPPNAFNFLSNINQTESKPKDPMTTTPETTNTTVNNDKETRFAKIKGLNVSVTKWINSHVEKNPICDLTPIFDDYKKYWDEIEKETTRGVTFDTKSDVPKTTEATPPVDFNFLSKLLPQPVTVSGNQGGGLKFPTVQPTDRNTTNNNNDNDDDDSPPEPKDNFESIKEDGSVYSVKSKVYFMENGSYKDKGIGYVFLKPVTTNQSKLQLIARMDNTSGTIIVNTVLTKSMPPVQKLNEKNVLVTCIPNPTTTTPVPVLFKVKNANEADQFIAKLNENLKEPVSH